MMKKIFYLVLCLFSAGAVWAQAPCSDFNSGVGSWTISNGYTWPSTNTLDATASVAFTGTSNPSTAVLSNTTDYNNLGSLYLGQCLQFDYMVENDGQNSISVPVYPRIYLTDATGNTIWFQASTPVSELTGWTRVIAPIELCAASTGPLPSNSYGSWYKDPLMTNTDFDNVMLNATSVYFLSVATMGFSQPPYAQEVIKVDNVCVVSCSGVPCSDFNDPVNPAGNWTCTASSAVYTNLSPDSTTCATISDGAGGSYFTNSTDYNNLGTLYLGQCLCFDYNIIDDGVIGSSSLINPAIYLTDGTGNYIWFEATATVTETSGWAHICAPIALVPPGGFALPSSPDGTWRMSAGMTLTDFNNVMLNTTEVLFIVDVAGSSAIAEIIEVDNVCVRECPVPCDAGFEFNFVINSDPAALLNYIGSVSLNNYHGSSTYRVDWGDGGITVLPPFGVAALSHLYAPGTYVICVTEIQPNGTQCTECIQICIPERLPTPSSAPGSSSKQENGDAEQSRINPISDEVKQKLATEETDTRVYIYPNPAGESAQIEFRVPNRCNGSIQVIDILGKVVLNIPEQVYENGRQKVNLNTKGLISGVYTVVITAGDKVLSEKLSVMR